MQDCRRPSGGTEGWRRSPTNQTAPSLVVAQPSLRAQSDWDIVKRGWYAHVLGEAEHTFKDPVEAVTTLRVRRLTQKAYKKYL